MPFLMFYITHADEKHAADLCHQLLENRLIACANLFPVRSAFWWNGALENEQEWVSVVKTTVALKEALEKEILRVHPYEVPCITCWEVSANKSYEDWIESSVVIP
jgi:periplasmic divalent cation tolerance protein